jgi:hypothetical protein
MNLPTDIYDNICSFLKLSLVIKLPYLNKKFINNFKKNKKFTKESECPIKKFW